LAPEYEYEYEHEHESRPDEAEADPEPEHFPSARPAAAHPDLVYNRAHA
jgi:hypothetical protein